jgi:hypothetical protein
LAKTKIELEKSTADLRQTVDILTVKLNCKFHFLKINKFATNPY